MTHPLGHSSTFPSTWGEVYAIFSGRVESVLDDLLDGSIDKEAATSRWVQAREELTAHSSRLAAEGAKAEYDRLRRY